MDMSVVYSICVYVHAFMKLRCMGNVYDSICAS